MALTLVLPIVGIAFGLVGLFRKSTRTEAVVLLATGVASAAVRMWIGAARIEAILR
jgi:hypothetical protein